MKQTNDRGELGVEKHSAKDPLAFVQVPPHASFELSAPADYATEHRSTHSGIMHLPPSLPLFADPSLFVPSPISSEAFAPFGHIIRAYPNSSTRPAGTKFQTSPDGKVKEYGRLSDIVQSYPVSTGAVTGISVFRATPRAGLVRGKVFDVRSMERHPYTSQAFIPMGKAEVSYMHCDHS